MYIYIYITCIHTHPYIYSYKSYTHLHVIYIYHIYKRYTYTYMYIQTYTYKHIDILPQKFVPLHCILSSVCVCISFAHNMHLPHHFDLDKLLNFFDHLHPHHDTCICSRVLFLRRPLAIVLPLCLNAHTQLRESLFEVCCLCVVRSGLGFRV